MGQGFDIYVELYLLHGANVRFALCMYADWTYKKKI